MAKQVPLKQAFQGADAPTKRGDTAKAAKCDPDKGGVAESQSERFIAKARELGLDGREETFDAALKKVARHRSSETVGASVKGTKRA